MKKIISFLVACLMLVSVGFTQAKKAPQKATQNKTTPVKKDGTPDKRYKANKETTAPVVVLKKDGTPDKRYKAKPTKKS